MAALVESPLIRRTIFVLAIGLGLASVSTRIAFIQSPRAAAADFSQDYLSAKAWNDGFNPYSDTSVLVDRYFGTRSGYYDLLPPGQKNPHPPAFILLNRPLADLNYRTARTIWLLLSASLTALAVLLFARGIGFSGRPALGLAIGSLAIPVVQTDLVYGQTNGILLLLLVAAWLALKKGKDRSAGICLGLAAALKLFPILFLLVLIRCRKTRALAWQLGTAAAVTAIAAFVMGIHRTVDFAFKVSPANVRYWRAAPMNLSAFSIPFRWLSRSVWRPDATNLGAIAWVIGLAILILCVVGALRTVGEVSGDPFWEAVPWILLATPIVWESYLVLVIPFVVLAIRKAVNAQQIPRLYVLLALAAVMIGLLPGLPAPINASKLAQILGYSLPTYGLLVLALSSARKRVASASSPIE